MYQYIISSLFALIILRIIYVNIQNYKHRKLKSENIFNKYLAVSLSVFFVFMIYERLT